MSLLQSSLKRDTADKSLNKMLVKSKVPLEKSLSMPDIENRFKKRERMMA